MQLSDTELLQSDGYVGGRWVASATIKRFSVYNPSTEELITKVSDLDESDTTEAVDAAAEAFVSWSKTTGKHRSLILRRWFELILENQKDLACILSCEQGKPLVEAQTEIVYGASFIEWFAEEAKRTYGDVIPPDKSGRRMLATKHPVGVVAAITPWNFPNAMITRKVGPALAAGCAVVLKPAPDTPLSALALAKLGERAGIPAGVFNVVPSTQSVSVGHALTKNSKIRKLSFTGSTQVGKLLMADCAEQVKKVSLELGGNAPFIIFNDADLDRAVKGLVASKFRNTGQTCVCTNRVYVQGDVHDVFVDKLTTAISELKVGMPDDPGVQQGPLINQAAVQKVAQHIQDAQSKGARLVLGGKVHSLGGSFFEPTLMTGMNNEMLAAREETFGPLASVFKFTDEEEVVQEANNTPYGLAAYVYTNDLSRAWRVSDALEYGMVGVNEGVISTEVAPFGGVKESGIGREGSRHGMDDYMELKYVCMSITESEV